MSTFKSKMEDFAEHVKDGKRPKMFVSNNILSKVIEFLSEEGFGVAEECLEKIKNEKHRELVTTLLYTTAAFSATGAALGSFGGVHGAAIGALVGAALGFGAGILIISNIIFTPDPNRAGYILSVA